MISNDGFTIANVSLHHEPTKSYSLYLIICCLSDSSLHSWQENQYQPFSSWTAAQLNVRHLDLQNTRQVMKSNACHFNFFSKNMCRAYNENNGQRKWCKWHLVTFRLLLLPPSVQMCRAVLNTEMSMCFLRKIIKLLDKPKAALSRKKCVKIDPIPVKFRLGLAQEVTNNLFVPVTDLSHSGPRCNCCDLFFCWLLLLLKLMISGLFGFCLPWLSHP